MIISKGGSRLREEQRGCKQGGKKLGKTEATPWLGHLHSPQALSDRRLWKEAERASKGKRLLLCGPKGCRRGWRLEGWRGLGKSRLLRDSPSLRAQDRSAGPDENCAASAQGGLAGRSPGPQQNSNLPVISAASLAILKGRRSAVGSQANWIWASSLLGKGGAA